MAWYLLIFTFFSCITVAYEPAASPKVPILPVTVKVHKRYYFVNRLQKTIQILAKINDTASQLHDLIYRDNLCCVMGVQFTHERITDSLKAISRTKSLKPLFMVWSDFARYRSLEDELFVVDFTKEIFVVTRSILTTQVKKSHMHFEILDILHVLDMLTNVSPEDFVELADEMACCIEQSFNKKFVNWAKLKRTISDCVDNTRNFSDIKQRVTSEQVCVRMYYTERVKKAIQVLGYVAGSFSRDAFAKFFSGVSRDTFEGAIELHNQQVISAIMHSKERESFEPILSLYEELRQFKYIGKEEFVRESLIVFFILQKRIVTSFLHSSAEKSVPIAEIIALYQTIDSLPIEGILSAIDLVSNMVVELSDKDKKKKEGKKWSTSFKKYWWVQPIIILTTLSWKVIGHYELLEKLQNILED